MPEASIRGACDKLFARYLKRLDGRPGVWVQQGRTMVVIETRQWKNSYSPIERARFDLTDEAALMIEVSGEENGVHLIPWHMILRITVNEGDKF